MQKTTNRSTMGSRRSAPNREPGKQESPVAPSVLSRLAQMASQQQVVAAIGFPCDIEDVAEEGD